MLPSAAPASKTEPFPPLAKATRHRLALLIVISFLMFVFGFVLRVGIEATSYDTTDRAGRPMGFNDPLHAEHYLIIARHFQPAELLQPRRAYEWLLLAMQAAGAWLLLRSDRIQSIRRFFAVQPVLFPLGLLFCWVPPLLVAGLLGNGLDRESFTDFPFVFAMGMFAHSTWVVCSLVIVFVLRSSGRGFFVLARAGD
jgi:hypothetical protein